MFTPEQDVRRFGNRVYINDYGMRSGDVREEKVPDERRILVFGDSVLNGGNLTDQSELATEMLSNRLNEWSKDPVTVGNVSAGSWGPGNWLAYVREFGFFEADVVVLLVSSQDIADNPTFAPLYPNTHPDQKPISALIERATRYLPRYLPDLGGQGEAFSDDMPPQVDRALDVAQGSADLRESLALADSRVSSVQVIQHPTRSELEQGHKAGRAGIAEIADSLGIPVHSVDQPLRHAIDQGESPYRDDIHINARGQRVLYEKLLRVLNEAGAISGP